MVTDPSTVTCYMMKSCSEAIGYYVLGAKQLDRDGDTIPCNELCIE